MQLPPGTIDYATVRENLYRMRQANFKPKMAPKLVKPRHRYKYRARKKQLRKIHPEADVIVFPCGILGSDGSFVGAKALAAHLQRTIDDARKNPAEAG